MLAVVLRCNLDEATAISLPRGDDTFLATGD